ncbi:mucosal addressin cell adhesion molecule 1 [Cuculus canorus]|uniref:mucosal addressin cell adhesion molecule 1 n=1 Tax=Cuculus canorus TaxID=55661 RepID=UPI0023AAB223|nr:mucosal addressin cell adhesion molecule 1 [Cuculus canorus]
MELATLLLLVGLLWGCSGRPANKLVVVPREPVVPYGGSVQLNCSLACPGGTVQWKGLDTNLGSITSFATHSILHISSAVVAMGGTKFCQGTCQGQSYQRVVNLEVYALPDRLQLDVEPHALVPGQPARLRCSAQRVYPPTGLLLTWYRGNQALEEADFDATETDEELFDIVSMLLVAGKEVEEGVEFRCELTLNIRQETFTRVASVTVSAAAVTEQSVAMATSTWSPRPAAATTGSPSTARPMSTTALPSEPSGPTTSLTTTPWEPDAETTLEPAAATKPPSTEHPTPHDLTLSSSMAPLATSALSSSGTMTPQAEGTTVDGIRWGSAPVDRDTGLSIGTLPACSLQIWSLPPNVTRGRALRIKCYAQCTGNATIHWRRTPVALSQYQEEVSGSSSTLRLDRAEPHHQGHYECVLLGHRSQVVSLQLTVLDETSSTVPAIATGTTVPLLGLIVSGIVSRRLWKRFRSRYELS